MLDTVRQAPGLGAVPHRRTGGLPWVTELGGRKKGAARPTPGTRRWYQVEKALG
jgi:hypothetical protein